MSKRRGAWTTRFGFYLAAIGSACGLGNLWRFPYVVSENGGGAFVLMYVLFALMLGLPLMIGELMLGRSTGKSILSAAAILDGSQKKKFIWIGRFSVLMSFVVLSYYAVISGWVLHFCTQFLTHIFLSLSGFLTGLFSGGASIAISGAEVSQVHLGQGQLELLLANGWLQMGLASVHLLIAVVVVLKGVQEGVEKWIGATMPLFAFLLVVLMIKSLSLATAGDAVRFLFYPDFAKLKLSSPLHAIGHVCFTLSVGFGSMVTFGSYMKQGEHIPTAGFRVAILDTVLSLLAGLLLFPIVLQASQVTSTDPGLLFEVLPKFLLQSTAGGAWGGLFGFAFFVCLYLAALGASIGLLEVIVSNLVDSAKISRTVAAWSTAVCALFLGLFPALSSTTFVKIKFLAGKSILEILDSILINVCLPLIALGVAWMISRGLNKKEQEKLFIDYNKIESVALFPHWSQVLRWLAPAVIALAFLLQLIELIR